MADQGGLVQVVRVALEASGVLEVEVAAHLAAAAHQDAGEKIASFIARDDIS